MDGRATPAASLDAASAAKVARLLDEAIYHIEHLRLGARDAG